MSPCLVCPNNEQDNFSSEVLIVGYTLVLFVLYNFSSSYWSIHSFPQTLGLTWPTLLFTVDAPSDLRFKILNENTVQMTWRLPISRIEGFRLQVVSDTGEWPYSCRFTQARMSALHSTYTYITNSPATEINKWLTNAFANRKTHVLLQCAELRPVHVYPQSF